MVGGIKNKQTNIEWGHKPTSIMKLQKVKLSSISEGLHKEVKKHMKEVRNKLEQMPDSIRIMVMKEVYGDDELSRSEYNDEWASKHDFDQDGAKNWNEVYDILKTGKFRRDSTEGLNYNDLFPNPKVQNVIKHLEKSGVINGNYFSKPISHQTFLNLVKYTIKKDKNLINPSRLKDYVNLDRIAKYYDGDYYKIVNPSSLSKEEEDLNKRLRFYPITHAHMNPVQACRYRGRYLVHRGTYSPGVQGVQ